MKTIIGPALRIFFFLTVLTGAVYPLLMTAFAQIAFPHQANGSLMTKSGKIVGSELIAQKFEATKYFHARPSSVDFNPLPSGGSNFGPTSIDLKTKVEKRRKAGATGDMLFSSGSGLDPHISPADADSQVLTVVAARTTAAHNAAEVTQQVKTLVARFTEDRQLKIFGEPRVNVLKLNLALDEMNTSQ